MQRFRTAIAVTLVYISLSIGFHVWSLHVRWDSPASYWWTDGLLALYVIQRFCETSAWASVFRWLSLYLNSYADPRHFISVSALYYYYYKRTMLFIADPKFYDISWLKGEWGHDE